MYSSRVQQWHPVGPAVSVASVTITDGASRTLLKNDVSVHDHLRKVPSQPIQRQPVGNVALNSSKQSQHPSLEQKQDRTPASTIAFPPKFPVMMRNNTLSTTILEMCERTLWHTLETTTIVLPEGDSFIHTGDINDLWLRDSAAQIHPLLVPFSKQEPPLVASDPRLARVVSGLIQRTAMYIRHDPYANAFRIDDTYKFSPEQIRLG